jgi:transcriptional regulator with XRE-family HTH domain
MMGTEAWRVPAWAIVAEARRRAGLSQAELARRSGTSQSAIARYERARAVPSLSTLYRLVRACGLELRIRLEPSTADPRQPLIEDALGRSVEDRLRSNDEFTRLAAQLQRTPAGDA